MASTHARLRRCDKKTKEGPKSVGEVFVPASEPEKKMALKRKLRDDSNRDSDSSLVRKKPSKPKQEKNLNEFTSSEPARKRARKALNKKERENLQKFAHSLVIENRRFTTFASKLWSNISYWSFHSATVRLLMRPST